jgi:hypothetical protein
MASNPNQTTPKIVRPAGGRGVVVTESLEDPAPATRESYFHAGPSRKEPGEKARTV